MKLQLVRFRDSHTMYSNHVHHGVYDGKQCLVKIFRHSIQTIILSHCEFLARPEFDTRKLEIWEEVTTKTFDELFEEFIQFAKGAFPEATRHTSLEKLNEEIKELKQGLEYFTTAALAVNPVEEYVDCIMCLIDSAARSGYDVKDLSKAFAIKLQVNKSRKWIKQADNTYSHQRDEDSADNGQFCKDRFCHNQATINGYCKDCFDAENDIS